MKDREKSSLRIVLPMLPLLLVGLCLPALADTLPAGAEKSAASLRGRLCRAETLAAPYIAQGMDEATAFSFAWVALCQEEAGKGTADEILEGLVKRNRLEEALKTLSPEQVQDLAAALEARAEDKGTNALSFTVIRQVLFRLFANENAAEALPHASGTTGSRDGRLSGGSSSALAAEHMPSVWWLEHYSGSLLQHEPAFPAFSPPPAPSGMPKANRVQKQPKQDKEEELAESYALPFAQATTEGTASLSAAALSSLSSGGGYAPAPLATVAELPTIVVADDTTQSVMSPTTVGAISLGVGSTLYVADTLTLEQGGTLSVGEKGTLLVKDGGTVILNNFTDGNEDDAKLFDAFVKAAQTEGSGYIQINNASVQFGTNYYHLPIGANNVNAVFNAHFEVTNNLTLQNYWQGNQGKESLWVVGENAVLHIGKDLYVSSYQTLVVKGGEVAVDGVAHLGHKDGSKYASTLDIQSGTVKLGQIQTETAESSTISMSGGSLQVTHEGNAFVNGIGEVNLSGGTLVANGNNWTLNHDASVGGIGVETDKTHTITLGTSDTTTTLTGDVTLNAGSNAVLNGTYAGTGTVGLEDGASLTLGQNFSTAAGSSVGLSGTGTVQVNWTGTLGSIDDGFTDAYHMNYTPSGLTGALNLEHAEGLVWKDAAGNTLHDVSYENGVLTGHLAADPTAYHIVTAGHQAKYDTDGNAAAAESFLLYNDGKLFIGENHSVSAAQVTQNGHTLTLQGSGDFDLNGMTMPAKVVFDSADGTAWTGAVVISGDAAKVMDFSDYYRQGSALAMDGFAGIIKEWNNGTLTANIRLDAQADGAPAWRWNNGSYNTTVATTFQGNWAGEGDFVLGSEDRKNWLQNFTYEGDISKWTGRFLVESGTTNVTLSGKVADVYAGFDKGTGTLNLEAKTDAVFYANATVNSLTVTDSHKITLAKGTEMHVANALLSGTNLGQHLQTDYFNHVSGEGTLFLNFGTSEYDQMSITAGQTVTPDVNTVFVGNGANQNLAISMWNATSGGLNLDHTFLVADEMTLQWGAGLTVGQTDKGAGSLVLNKLHIGHSNNANNPARVTLSGGTMMLGQIDISSTHKNTFNMTGGVLEITNSGNALTTTATGTEQTSFTLAGGTLRADGSKWVWNHDAVIGEKNGSALSVETLNGGAVTIGAAGVTTTLANTIDNRGSLTLDGTVNITMDVSNVANGYVDQDGNFGMSVGFAAIVEIPGVEIYNVVTGNAATLGNGIIWKAGDKELRAEDYYFDGYNLRRTDEETAKDPVRTGTVYYVGGRGGEYSFNKAEYADIVTGFDIANGTLHVTVSPANEVSLNLGAGSLQLGEKVEMNVGSARDWSMDQGASVVLGEGSVLTLPGVEPETKADSYKVYQLLNNSTGSGTIVFDGTLDVQFGNAGHNFVSPDSYNILEDNGTADKGVNADIKTNVVVKGDMLIQNYRQGKDHPEVGSWWKVSEGGSLTVQGDLESSSYQKMSVEGGQLVVGGSYKIGHEAGREYEGDLELKNGSLTVGTLQTVHEDTSTVHISGGKLTVTKDNAFANTFREVSARDAEFEGEWTWNHDAVIGNITVTEGSAITLGTADTTLTLESPLKNHGALTLDGTIKAEVEKEEGAWAYGTDALGYTPDGDGYYKRTDDLYTLISEGNDAELGAHVSFILNGQTLSADEFRWDGKAIGMGGTEAGTVYYLNTANGYTYTDADTRTTSFELVNTGATLRLERDPASLETIHALGGTLSLGSGVRMESALLNAEDTVTMAGEGTYLLSNNTLMAHPAAHHVSFADSAWTGTVQMDGMLGSEGTLNELGNENSWVEMQGVFGADAAPSMDVNVKLTDKDGQPAWIYTGDGHDVAVTGDWAGEGTFAFAPVGGAAQKLTYSGDLTNWTGTFSAEGGTAQLHFSGEAQEVNAEIHQNGGRIELTADTDAHFTNKTQAALYEATGGDLTADKADAAAIESIRATGGNVTLKDLASDTSVELKELVIGDSHAVTALAAGGNAADAVLGEGSILTAGQATTLTTNLSVESGAQLSIADRTQGLALNGALSLGDGGGIQLDVAMKTALKETGRLVLFSGVSKLTLPDGTTITGALSALDNVEAERYFSGLLERLNANGTGETYYLTYSGAENGGFLCIETPEPTTALLSLLSLLGLAARRRR